MKNYIGVKQIKAERMNLGAYNLYQGWKLPADQNSATPGYLVEYLDGGKPNHHAHVGYISWSPKAIFENSYKETDGLTFGLALEALKLGHSVARKGWNGKGIFIQLQLPDNQSKMTSPYIFIDTTGLQTDNENAPKSLVPWLASQTDMLAEDWVIL